LLARPGYAKTAPILLIFALLAALAFATTASAEVRVGEATAPVNGAIPAEADVVAAGASYDSTSGAIRFVLTAAGPPIKPEFEEEEGPAPTYSAFVALTDASEECLPVPYEALLLGEGGGSRAMILSIPNLPEAEFVAFNEGEETVGLAKKTVSGLTTTLSITASSVKDEDFNCAVVGVMENGGEGRELPGLAFSLAAVPPPPVPAPVVQPAPAPVPPPAPAPPPALSIAKAKPLKLKVGKPKAVKVKVTNTGATATEQGSLRVKAPAGFLVKPERQKIPVLRPGASWTLSFSLQPKPNAKSKSTISLTGTAPGLRAKSSFVVRLLGQVAGTPGT
jgi:hypothetical protein